MALIMKEGSDKGLSRIRKDKRGEAIRIDFEEPTHVNLCVDDGTDLRLLRSLSDTEHISSWASHINVYDAHNKKPVLKSSFMKCRKAKSPDKMRATAIIEREDTGGIRVTVAANQYKFKKMVRPFDYEENNIESGE